MPFRVYLPPCYGRDLDQRYPVLYLMHGQSYTDDQWERLGVPDALDRLVAAGELPPFLVVLPRDRELVTQPDTNRFGDAVAQELAPWVDAHFRTLTGPSYRAIGGLSRGGGWALHIVLNHGELFGALGLHSAAIFWTDTAQIRPWLGGSAELPRIYMDIGDRDSRLMESNRWFAGLLDEYRLPHEWHLFSGYHEEAYWEEHVEDYLRWYAQDW
jgi:enterochelin esterase-like enzyme